MSRANWSPATECCERANDKTVERCCRQIKGDREQVHRTRELVCKEKATAEMAAFLELSKKDPGDLGGQIISVPIPQNAVELIDDARGTGSRFRTT